MCEFAAATAAKLPELVTWSIVELGELLFGVICVAEADLLGGLYISIGLLLGVDTTLGHFNDTCVLVIFITAIGVLLLKLLFVVALTAVGLTG